MKKLLLGLALLFLPAFVQGQIQTGCSSGQGPASCTAITTSGNTLIIPNFYGGMNTSFEELMSGAPATVSVAIQGCAPGNTCDTAFSTNTTVAAGAIVAQVPTTKVYSYFKVTASWTGGTNVSIQVNPILTTARGGSGLSTAAAVVALFTGCSGTQYLGADGACHNAGGSGTVTSAGLNVNGGASSGIFAVTGSPVTTSGTLNFNLAGNSGGVPYFSSGTVVSSSGALTSNVLVKGGGAGAAPANSLATDNGTTLTYSGAGGINLSSANASLTDVEGVAPSGVASSDILWADSTAHRWKMINNNGTAAQVVASGADISTSDTVTNGSNITNSSIPNTGLLHPSLTIAVTSPITGGGLTALGATSTAIACATCVTSSGGGAITGTAPVAVSAAGAVSITGAAGQVLAGASPAFTATPSLGTAGSVVGTVSFANATSGSVTLSPVTGALGAVTVSLPAATGTAALDSASDTTTTHVLHATATGHVYTSSAIVTGDLPTAIPIANIGSAGLSGTAPVTIASTGVIACATCATTTNGGAISLDKSATGLINPAADATFTYPIASTTGLTLAGTQPASSAANGTAATTLFNVSGAAGGQTSSTGANTGGTGSAPAITGGAGGSATGVGGTTTVGGAGGSVTLTSGAGGAGTAGNDSGGAGGNIVLTTGLGGAATGSGVAGVPGQVQVTGSAGLSQSAFLLNGNVITSGSATTNFPVLAIWPSGATGPTTWSANGTYLGVNSASGFTGNFIDFHLNGGGSAFSVASNGVTNSSTATQAPLFRAAAAGTAVTYTSGFDGTTNQGAATFKGGSINSTATSTLSGGTATLQGGDNAGTGTAEVAGAATVRGGDATGTTANNETAGALTARGGNVTATGTTSTPGLVTITGGSIVSAATNVAGADTLVQGGLGTGNSTPSRVKLQHPCFILTSGTTAQTECTFFTPHVKGGSTTSATATTMFNVASATNTAWGIDVLVHVDLISSTPNVCGTTERFSLTGTNNNGAFGTVNIVAGTLSTLCSAGTLTLAVTCTAANPSVCSVTPSWATITSITSDTISIVIENPSLQEIALL